MNLKIGMRVKKVRGAEAGLTGVVIDYLVTTTDRDFDIRVAIDQCWVSDIGLRWPAGSWANCISANWEPILDSDQSAEDTRALGRELLGTIRFDVPCEVEA